MSDYPWYGLADGDDLQQGDLLLACPFDRVDGIGIADRKNFHVVIMSHQLKPLASSQKPSLRLLSPYREHLAQALARFYMRVGLPVDIPAF